MWPGLKKGPCSPCQWQATQTTKIPARLGCQGRPQTWTGLRAKSQGELSPFSFLLLFIQGLCIFPEAGLSISHPRWAVAGTEANLSCPLIYSHGSHVHAQRLSENCSHPSSEIVIPNFRPGTNKLVFQLHQNRGSKFRQVCWTLINQEVS